MKKIYFLSILFFAMPCLDAYHKVCDTSCFDLAFTSGFIWKHDKIFKEVYGHGIPDLITVDACYYPCNYGGIGIKTSFWEKKGRTACLKQCTKLQEVPLIGYLRARIGTWLQGYASLGGGAIFVKEKSYLGSVRTNVGIGEAEVGLNYYPHENVYLTGAFRCLFPRKTCDGDEIDFGGFGLRGGIGFSY